MADASILVMGIMCGIVIGKPLGVVSFSFIATKLHIAEKPEKASWISIAEVALLTGIGFTMSIFVTEIAFSGNQDIIDASKICILVSGVLSSTLTCTTIFLKPYLNRRYIISHLPFGLGK